MQVSVSKNLENVKEGGREESDADEEYISKPPNKYISCRLKKRGLRVWTGFIWHRRGTRGGFL
jgi:hypothetical protein